ncbi:hypothetical protein FDZ71_10630, partial [bacterium]
MITITVTPRGSGWDATADPDPAEVQSNDTIVWEVPHMTPPVTVRNFRLKSGPNADLFSSNTPPGGPNKITKRVKDQGFAPVYKYDIFVGEDRVADPDIQI